MERPEYFVIRVYRRDAEDPGKIEGIVEIVASSKTLGFGNLGELGAILQAASLAKDQHE